MTLIDRQACGPLSPVLDGPERLPDHTDDGQFMALPEQVSHADRRLLHIAAHLRPHVRALEVEAPALHDRKTIDEHAARRPEHEDATIVIRYVCDWQRHDVAERQRAVVVISGSSSCAHLQLVGEAPRTISYDYAEFHSVPRTM